MRQFLVRLCCTVLILAGMAGGAAADFLLPGLQADSDAYANTLTARNPAGGTPAARVRAEQQAAEASRRQDWTAVAAAWESRIALGNAAPAQWLALAQAEMRRSPPDYRRALQAAWQNFSAVDTGPQQIPALALMADALRGQDRAAQAVEALQAAVDRAPDDAQLRQTLADARTAAGLLVRSVRAEPEADPPRACLTFTVPPARSPDFHPADWIRLDPPMSSAAITREGDQICVSGLPSGATTALILRTGLPGEGGLSLKRETRLAVAMGNRSPRIAFDTRLFLLPRGAAPSITLTTVNLSAVKLTLAKLTERTMLSFTRDNRLGEPVAAYSADEIGQSTGQVVWEGRADIPGFAPNRSQRTALPLPDVLAGGSPGLYALTARTGDGTPGGPAAVQMILRTDLGPTVWRGDDGLTIQVRSFADARPRANVAVDLLAENNDVLAQAVTDSDGVARFGAPLLHGPGPRRARALHLTAADGDLAALDLDSAAFDLSDRGVAGQAAPGPLDAFVWLDRGIYRPGETVQVMALLRDAAGVPTDIPAQVTIKRPNGQIFSQLTPPRLTGAALHVPVPLSAGAAAGVWTVEIRADPAADPIGQASFRVDAFVPDRMAVDLGPVPGPIVPGQPYALPVAVRFLYGAPGAGLSGKATLRLAPDPAPFPALAGYEIGLAGEIFAPDSRDVDLPDTDADGHAALPITLAQAPDTTHAVRATVEVAVDDPSGHAARATADIPVRPSEGLIGIKPLFKGGAVDAGAEAAFDVAAVSPLGARVALPVTVRLVRERPDWRMMMRGGLASYEIAWRDEPLETLAVTVPADAPLHIARTLDFGRYRLEVTAAQGLAATSVRFRSGWASSDSPDVPDRVDVSAGRASYRAGETARIHITPPFAGEATVVVMIGRVQSLRTLSVPAGGADVDVPVGAEWGPGAYVGVHLFRPPADARTGRPQRAIGLTWVGLDPAPRRIDVSMDTQPSYLPRGGIIVPVHAAPGAWVTLAAVDEGILRLTQFPTPDPVGHFLGRRTLGLDIRDDWGRLIAPADGAATLLHEGGGDDGGSFAMPTIPQTILSLFVPPVQAGADGIAAIPLDLPDFAGQVRLMAVAWDGDRIGAVSQDILVRDPLVAETLLPRFLAPGDEARLAVLMQNVELPAGEAAVDVTVEGPLALTGPSHLTATLAAGAQAVPATTIKATGVGQAHIRLAVTGPGGFSARHETPLTVRPARGTVTTVAGAEQPAGGEFRLASVEGAFLPGSWRGAATFGGAVRYDMAGLVQALDAYQLNCLEQATSRGFPLAVLPDGDLAGPQRAARLQAAVGLVLDRQRFDGGFGLWSAAGDAEPWLSAYATEFLLRARSTGAAVPAQVLVDALHFLGEATDNSPDSPEDFAAQAYDLYVLGLGGRGRPGAVRVLAAQAGKLPTPLARMQLAAALAMAHEPARATVLATAALASLGRKPWGFDYGTALRDQVAIALILKETGLLPERLSAAVAALPGADLNPMELSTQEQAWAAAAGAILGRDGHPVQLSVDGRALPSAALVSVPVGKPVTIRNLASTPVWRSVAVTGVPVSPLPAARNQMRVTRSFLDLAGQPVDLDHLRQNTVFVLLIEGRAEDGQDHRLMLMHGLPAGWEIVARLTSGTVPGASWLGTLSETEAQPALDDRFAAVVNVTGAEPGFRLALRLRAVTPGSFELPGAELSDMYRPTLFARQNAGRVTVLPQE